MNHGMIVFLVASGIILALLICVAVYYYRRTHGHKKTWDQLLARLITVDRDGIQAVALDAIEPSGRRRTDDQARELTPDQIWKLLGGVDGVEVLEKNSHVLIEMAIYLRRWHPEAAAIAEDLRLQAKELEWQVNRLKMAAEKGHLQFHFASYAQNATIGYYLMTQRLLDLYRRSKVPMLIDLEKAL